MLKCFGSTRIDVYGSKPLTANNLISDHTVSLLDHQLDTVIPIVVIGYVVLQIAMGLDWAYSATPICNESYDNISWAKYAMCTAAGCMVLTCTQQAMKIRALLDVPAKRRNMPLVRTQFTLFVMCFVSGSSQFLTFFWHYGGVCQDRFG
jgi:hypothetical protein